ncbi:hypothetical protein B0H13DRAFT_1972444 [Mycena leptocephala]|nr:hypothetical protein B0H13DRAFT_1972444 [Mycena leptocephala]
MHPLEPTVGSRSPRDVDDDQDQDCDRRHLSRCAPQPATSPMPDNENAMHWEQLPPNLEPDAELPNTSSYSMFSDVALDTSDIVIHLNAVHIENPQDTESDDGPFSLEHILRDEALSTRVPPLALEDDARRTTAMMELQRLEDEFVGTLKRLLDLGVPRATLAPQISPSISKRLFNTG